MRTIFLALTAIFITGTTSTAQRSIRGDSLFSEFRPDGELRMWTFVVKDSTIGRLFSTVRGDETVDGEEGRILEQRYSLDFARIGAGVSIDVEGRHFIAEQRGYLGSELTIKTADEPSRLEIKRDGNFIRGSVTQNNRRRDLEASFSPGSFAADVYMLDLHEIFLAMRDIAVGDTIRDSIFVPQLMSTQYVEASVDMFVNKQLYKGVFDSTFVIRYRYPQEQTFYFTPDKRLVKVEIPGQELKAYLDVVRKMDSAPEGTGSITKGRSGVNIVKKWPLFVAYCLLGLAVMVLFAGRRWRWGTSWLGLIAGGVVFIVAIFTQMPLQMYLVEKLLIPNVTEGGSPYFWGVFPSLTAGLIQELLKASLIFVFAFLIRVRADRLTLVGAVTGAGFGVMEGCYLATLAVTADFFSWHLLERGFWIMYHAAAGGLLGHSLSHNENSRRFSFMLVSMILFNSALRYLPVFVQQNVINVQMMYFVLALTVIALTGFAFRRFQQDR